MTPATTGADSRRSGRIFWMGLIGLSILAHILGWMFFGPYAKTSMILDRQAAEELVADVRERERERRELEAEQREKIQLEKEDADKLVEEAERLERRQALEELEQLERVKEEIDTLREDAMRELQEREIAEALETDLPELKKHFSELESGIEDLKETAEPPDTDALSKQLENAKAALEVMEQALEKGGEPTGDLADTMDAMEDDLAKTATEAKAEGDADRAETAQKAGQSRKKVADAAREIARKTASAETASQTGDAAQRKEPPRDMPAAYEQARETEQQARQAYAELRAAQLAREQSRSFEEARKQVGDATPPARRDLTESLAATPPGDVGELNEYRATVKEAGNQMKDMTLRSQALLSQAMGQAMSTDSSAVAQALAAASAGQSGGGMSAGLRLGEHEDVGPAAEPEKAMEIPEKKIIQEALPGRMFTDVSERKGWLYLDTWYVIGPWENDGTPQFDRVYPPELEIDFDARYADGKFAGEDGHPEQILTWHFVQSDEVRIEPPVSAGKATYYAYTEVYFSEAREMAVAFGADAAGRIWVNDELVWEDDLRSTWDLTEDLQAVKFQKGYNRVLVRLMNGRGTTAFSVLLCPREVLPPKRSQARR